MRPLPRKRVDDWRNYLPDIHLPLMTSLAAAITGLGGGAAASFSRSTTATVVDFEGVVKECKINEARFYGARRVENLFRYSEDFSNALWLKLGTGAPATVTPSAIVPPAGVGSCFLMDISTAADARVAQSIPGLVSGRYIFSFYVRSVSGSGTWGYNINSNNATAAIDTNWKRVQVFIDFVSGASMNIYPAMRSAGGTMLTAIVAGAQLEIVGGSTINDVASEYVSKDVITSAPYNGAGVDGVRYIGCRNGNSVASNVITEARGLCLSTMRGMVVENARTNIELNASTWSVTAGTCVFQAANPDRMGRQSALFTEDTSASFHFAYQGSSTRTVGTVYTYSVYVKAGTASKLQLTSGVAVVGADAYANYDLAALAITAQGAAVSGAFIEDAGDGWRRIGFTSTAILTTSAANILVATLQTGLETRLPSFTGTGRTFYRAMGQVEAASLTTYCHVSTFIPTALSNVTRSDDLATYVCDYSRLSRSFAVAIGFFIDYIVPFADRRTLSFTDNTVNRFQVVAHNNSATPQTGFFFGDGSAVSFHYANNAIPGQGWFACCVRRKARDPVAMSNVAESRYTVANLGADVAPTRLTLGASGGALFGPVRNVRVWASEQRDDTLRMWAKQS